MVAMISPQPRCGTRIEGQLEREREHVFIVFGDSKSPWVIWCHFGYPSTGVKMLRKSESREVVELREPAKTDCYSAVRKPPRGLLKRRWVNGTIPYISWRCAERVSMEAVEGNTESNRGRKLTECSEHRTRKSTRRFR